MSSPTSTCAPPMTAPRGSCWFLPPAAPTLSQPWAGWDHATTPTTYSCSQRCCAAGKNGSAPGSSRSASTPCTSSLHGRRPPPSMRSMSQLSISRSATTTLPRATSRRSATTQRSRSGEGMIGFSGGTDLGGLCGSPVGHDQSLEEPGGRSRGRSAGRAGAGRRRRRRRPCRVERLDHVVGPLEMLTEPHVAVEADGHAEGRVTAELDEGRPEVAVPDVEVVVLDVGAAAGGREAASLALLLGRGAEHVGLLLGDADQDHALPPQVDRRSGRRSRGVHLT